MKKWKVVFMGGGIHHPVFREVFVEAFTGAAAEEIAREQLVWLKNAVVLTQRTKMLGPVD